MTTKQKALLIGFAILAVVVLALITLVPRGRGDRIRIGAILPMTGDLAFLGEGDQRALQIFQDRNTDVAIQIEDSKGTTRDGLTAANHLLSEGVQYFLTSLSYVVSGIQPALDERGAVNMTLSMDEAGEQQSEYCLRLYVSFLDEMHLLADLASQERATTVAVLYTDAPGPRYAVDEYLRRILQEHGITLITESFPFGTADFRPMLQRLNAANPRVVRVLDIGTNLPIILAQASELQAFQGASAIASGIETLFIQPTDIPAAFSDRFQFSAPPEVYSDNWFVREFSSRFHERPTYDAMFAYDAAALLVNAIRQNTGASPLDISHAIAALGTYTGVAATYRINDHGGVSPHIEWARFQGEGVRFLGGH